MSRSKAKLYRDKVITVLKKNGGEILAEDGSYRLPSSQKLFGVPNSTIVTLVQNGVIAKVGTRTSTRGYKLAPEFMGETYVVPSQKPVDREVTIPRLEPIRATFGKPRKPRVEIGGKVRFDQDRLVAEAAIMLFGDVRGDDLLAFVQWVNITKELM